jgi:hypothetical protein
MPVFLTLLPEVTIWLRVQICTFMVAPLWYSMQGVSSNTCSLRESFQGFQERDCMCKRPVCAINGAC